MLPHIHGEQGLLAVGQGQVGVGGLGDFQGAAIEHQPGPTAAELGGAGGFELLDEGLVAAEISVDLVGQGAAGLATTAGLHALPIKAVVPHLSCVVENASLASITSHCGDGVFQALGLKVGASHQVVEVGHVGSVVLAVVKLQGGAGDVGLERIEAVGQRGQRVSHGEEKDDGLGRRGGAPASSQSAHPNDPRRQLSRRCATAPPRK